MKTANNIQNSLQKLVPEASDWSHIIRIVNASDEQKVVLSADTIKQNAVIYVTE